MPLDTDAVIERLRAVLPRPPAMKRVAPSMHTLYWGAHRFGLGTAAELIERTRDSFARHVPDAEALAAIFAIEDRDLAERVHESVRQKLVARPIEDIRIDFEDGYGLRPDREEDGAAEATARAAAALHDVAVGIRIKSLTPETARRSIATLERFVGTLVEARSGLPEGFCICLPKVTTAEQTRIAVELLSKLEQVLSLPAEAIGLEIMVEVPQGLFDRQGRLVLPALLEAGGRRLVGIHLGVYDFTTSYGVAPTFQTMDHPACDFARALIRLVFSGSGRVLSAGSTNVLPVASEGEEAVLRALRLSHDQIRHTLVRGYYHGWDLHPAQIPARWVACHRFFLEGFEAAAARLSGYLGQGSAATDDSAVLDDAATGQALLDFFVRARASGAIDDDDLTATGLTADELALGSFSQILRQRLTA